MKYHFIRTILLLILSINLLHAQNGLYNNGSEITLTGTSLMSIRGNFSNVGTNPNLRLGTGSLYITGDVENNQIFSSAAGSLYLTGTSQQEVKGTNPILLNNLIINNPSSINLTTGISVSTKVDFTDGMVIAPNKNQPLHFSTGATYNFATDQHHVNGYVSRQSTGTNVDYPVGDGSRLQVITIGSSTNFNYVARYQPGDALPGPFIAGSQPTLLKYYNPREYWEVSSVTSSPPAVTVRVNWDDYNNVGISSTADLRVAYKDAGSWRNIGVNSLTGTAASGSLTSDAFATDGIITLGSISTNSTLPANWLSVSGKLNEQKKAQIKWSVNEYSVSDYSVERSSDARSYTAIGALNSKGDGQHEYYFTDANTDLKTAFYRIKQTDWNGKFTYSPMIKITRQENANNEPSVFPNPFINGFTVLTNKQENAKLYNAAGKLIRQLTLSSGSTYVSTGIICSGLYYLQFENGKTIMLTKQ